MLNNPGDAKENGRTRWPVHYYKITVMYEDDGGATIAHGLYRFNKKKSAPPGFENRRR